MLEPFFSLSLFCMKPEWVASLKKKKDLGGTLCKLRFHINANITARVRRYPLLECAVQRGATQIQRFVVSFLFFFLFSFFFLGGLEEILLHKRKQKKKSYLFFLGQHFEQKKKKRKHVNKYSKETVQFEYKKKKREKKRMTAH